MGRLEAFSGRLEVEPMHPDLAGKAVLISGHHGWQSVQGDRIICDASGGKTDKPLEAIVLEPDGTRTIYSTGDPSVRPAAEESNDTTRVRKESHAALEMAEVSATCQPEPQSSAEVEQESVEVKPESANMLSEPDSESAAEPELVDDVEEAEPPIKPIDFVLPRAWFPDSPTAAICRAVPVAPCRTFGAFAEKTLECNTAARNAIDTVCNQGGFTQSWAKQTPEDIAAEKHTMIKIPAIILVKLMLGLKEDQEYAVQSLIGAYAICMRPESE